MRYGSVCSGIEAATVAWHPLGWEASFYSEIEPFPCKVLDHHYPDVPNLGDMTKFKEWPDAAIDVLVGGTPCQSFSVAGLRKGLADPRGNHMLTFGAIASKYRPRWLVWENVPGVLSSDGGRDFGTFLGMLAELGYGFAYRVLDAQFVRVQSHRRAVPQRRRRVFVVGYLGDWRRAAAVLFERESLSGNSAPSREKRQRVTAYPESSIGGYREDLASGTLKAQGGVLGGGSETFVSATVTSKWSKGSGGPAESECGNLVPVAFAQNTRDEVRLLGGDGKIAGALAAEPGMKQQTYLAFNNRQDPVVSGDVCQPIGSKDNGMAVCFGGDVVRSLTARHNSSPCADRGMDVVTAGMAVRRLTPRECERLQGFPDDYTKISDKTADGPRYKALGNSMAVNVMSWIGHRIKQVEGL